MSTQEEIDEQQRLLATHRGTLAILLRQRAQHTSARVPPVTEHSIHEARENIKRIKQTLREWGVPVEEHPDDEEPLTIQSTLTPTHNSPLPADYQGNITDDKMAQARLLTRKARVDFEATNYVDAEKHLRLAVQLDPDSPSAWGLFGRILNRLGKYDEAVPTLSRAIELTRLNQSLFLFHRGVAYTMLGKYGRALEDFDNRLKTDPNNYRALRWRAMVWLYLRRPGNTLVDVERCITLKPEHISAHATKAIALYQLGRMDDANKELAIVDSLRPEDEGDFYCLALAYSQLKTPKEAIDALRIAIEIDPRYIARSPVEPLFEQLKDDSHFQRVIKKA